jgi:hypothetical protein
LRVARVTEAFSAEDFDCAEPEYNTWLTARAWDAVRSGSAAVYLLLGADVEGDSGQRVVGYYAICPTLVARADLPGKLQGGLIHRAPAWLVARLARDVSLRGDRVNRWGDHLLRAALETIVDTAGAGGGQVIVVDAGRPELIVWYEQRGFKQVQEGSPRLAMKMSTARKYLAR